MLARGDQRRESTGVRGAHTCSAAGCSGNVCVWHHRGAASARALRERRREALARKDRALALARAGVASRAGSWMPYRAMADVAVADVGNGSDDAGCAAPSSLAVTAAGAGAVQASESRPKEIDCGEHDAWADRTPLLLRAAAAIARGRLLDSARGCCEDVCLARTKGCSSSSVCLLTVGSGCG